MAELIASSTSAATSADFTLSGTNTTLSLKGSGRPFGTAEVQIKGSNGSYTTVGLLSDSEPAGVIGAVGTFRVSKSAALVAFGVDRD